MGNLPITFFILGAAKSGTTSLHSYLDAHSQISMAKLKETNFFVERNRRIDSIEGLNAQFEWGSEIVERGDSSHLHLSSPECAARIRAECPDARFVVLLRDPVERAHSLYLHNRRNGSEAANTFERALALETIRSSSDRFQRRCRDHPDTFRYVDSGRYDVQLELYFQLFPEDRFLISTFEEFVEDPQAGLVQVHRFLGVEPVPLSSYPNRLPGGDVPRFARPAALIHKEYSRRSAFRVRLAHELRKPTRPVPSLDPVTRDRLREELTPSVKRLSTMLGRPSMWWLSETEARMEL